MKLSKQQENLLWALRNGHNLYRVADDLGGTKFRYELRDASDSSLPELAPHGRTVAALIRRRVLAFGPLPARFGAPRRVEMRKDPAATPNA
jgi:hypothetical protein